MQLGLATRSPDGEAGGGADWRAGALAARPFGLNAGDLDIDFNDADRPAVVTRVLASCLLGVSETQAAERTVWDWTLPARLQGLLAIGDANEANASWQTRCRHCAEAIEFDVRPSDFVTSQRLDEVECRAPDGRRIKARLPRGSDQRAWRAGEADACAMATTLIEYLDERPPEPGWRVPAEWLDGLDEALAESDPLTALQFYVTCPDCGQLNVFDFDLEAWVLGRLQAAQARLIDDVHRLAAAYHWSEVAICAMPPWRRRAYLARLEREVRE